MRHLSTHEAAQRIMEHCRISSPIRSRIDDEKKLIEWIKVDLLSRAAKDKWIAEFSDHSLLCFELQKL